MYAYAVRPVAVWSNTTLHTPFSRNPSRREQCHAPTKELSTSWRICSRKKRSGAWGVRPASSQPFPWLRRPAMSPHAAHLPSKRKKVGLPDTQAHTIKFYTSTNACWKSLMGIDELLTCYDGTELSFFFHPLWLCLTLILPAEEVVNLATRRLSVSPSCASSNSHRNYSFRRGSVWSVRSLASAEGMIQKTFLLF